MTSTSDFVDATELSGTLKEGFDDAFLKQLGRAFSLRLARTPLDDDGPVVVASDGLVPQQMLRGLVDGLLVAGCDVVEMGALDGEQLELVQIATSARGALRMSRAQAAPDVSEGTFLDATQEESLPDPDAFSDDVAFAVEVFVGRVPQMAERLHELLALLTSSTSTTGKASHRQAAYEDFVPDAERAEALREHVRAQTIVETVAS